VENSRELDRVVHGYRAKLGVRHRSGICAQAKDRCVLTGERLRECGAVREVSVQNLFQLGVRDAEVLASDSRHSFDGVVSQRTAKGVSADHSGRAHNNKTYLDR